MNFRFDYILLSFQDRLSNPYVFSKKLHNLYKTKTITTPNVSI